MRRRHSRTHRRLRPPRAPDPIEQLKQLAELKDQGILTEQEFAEQKAQHPRLMAPT